MTLPAEPAMLLVKAGDITISNALPFTLICGPCQIESRDAALRAAEAISNHAAQAGVPLIFKSSFDKANRTSIEGKRGLGIQEGLAILDDVRREIGCPVLTDVHDPQQCAQAAEVVDILQIPALLCRQTDLLLAAGATGRPVNIKKGQFLAPEDIAHAAAKVCATGNDQVMLTERGTSFGYHTLVNDMRALPIMTRTGHPVFFDATHSVQTPSGRGASSGGERSFAPLLANAALAIGVAGIFAEAHFDPDRAPSDGAVMLPIDWLPRLLARWRAIDELTKSAELPIRNRVPLIQIKPAA